MTPGAGGPFCSIRTALDGATLTITIVGELDAATCPPLTELGATLDPGVDQVVVDLAATTFMDSSGLRTIIKLPGAGTPRLRVVNATGSVRRLIDIVGMTEHLGITDRPAG